MEFWGVEIKPGETVKCDPGQDKYLHLSQASLGELKKDKGNENVPIFVKFNDKKLVLGTLSAEKSAQISYDLVFEKEFELSHSSKNTSVFFCGYKTVVADDDEIVDFQDSDSDSEEDVQLGEKVNGKTEVKDEQAKKPTTGKAGIVKADASAAKPKVRIEEPNKADKQKDQKVDEDDEDDEEDESEEDEDESEEGSDDDEDMAEAEDDSDAESSAEEDESTPQKTESGKRLAGSASKTPAPEKKAKLVTPVGSQKIGRDAKKGGHIATPHPAKHAGKTPANSDKAKQQSPKSAGSVSCKSCNKTFNSEHALQAHSKAKHGPAK